MKTHEQLASCATREYRRRKAVYPRLIKECQMDIKEAQHELDCMKEIMRALVSVVQNKTDPNLSPVERFER